MRIGICPLCSNQRALCRSHALPDSLFNYLFRRNSGKAISLVDDPSVPIQYGSDSWAEEMLCEVCEDDLNKRFDSFAMAVLHGKKYPIQKSDRGIKIVGFDQSRFGLFLLAVLWRASQSTHPGYSDCHLPNGLAQGIKQIILTKKHFASHGFGLLMSRLRDTTPGGFNDTVIRELVLSPFRRMGQASTSLCFPLLGFFVEIFLPPVEPSLTNRLGLLGHLTADFDAPYLEITEIPEVMNSMLVAMIKHSLGHSKL